MANPFEQFALPSPQAPPPEPMYAAPPQPPMNAPPANPYGAPPQPYGAPQPQFNAPPPQPYGAPQPQFNAPPPQPYGAPQPQFDAPPPQSFGAPQPQFDAPPPQPFGAPQPQFDAPPPQSHGTPQPQFDAPPQPYGAPQPQFGAPPPQPYGAPPQQYGAPSQGYDQSSSYEQQTQSFSYGQPPAAPEQPAPGIDSGNPFGPPPAAAPPAPAPPVYDAPPTAEQSNPFAQPPPQGDAGNPFGAPESQPPAPPSADPWGAPQPPSQPSQPPAYQQPPNPYAAPPPQPYGAPPQPYGAPTPFGAPEAPDASMGALVPAQQQSNPYAVNPYGQQPAYGAPPPQQPPSYGAPPQNPYGYPPQPYGQPAPPPVPPAVDPFSVFESQALVPVAPTQQTAYPGAPPATSIVPSQQQPAATSDDDFWGGFSGNALQPAAVPESEAPAVAESKTGEDGLPPGGEWYDAKIFTPTLGVMFFKPQELTDSLFLNTDKSIVDALGERPVVAFIVEGSSARAAGVELGHVLLKVNGVDVKNPKDASRLIKEGPRPLPLLFYVPNTDVVVAEGEHMVKYDTRDTIAPNSAKEWKPKYVVIGGIIAQPWMMNMYRSKSEYDIAVIETQARRPVSVKVKQFSLQGARIQNDWQGPQMVKYKNKLQPWKYIVVLPVARNPIKISSPNLAQLKPVHEGIRRVLLAQQRSRGGDGGRNEHDRHQEPHRY